MALTDSQKAALRRYLGWTDKDRGLYNALEGAFLAISDEAVTQLGVHLDDLATIESRLRSTWDHLKVRRVEDVEFAGGDEVRALRSEGNRLVLDISSILGVDYRVLPFRSGQSSGVCRRG